MSKKNEPEESKFDEIKNLSKQARDSNDDAFENIPPETQIAKLAQDAGYFKKFVYVSGVVIVGLFVIGWTLFLHLDKKIESKLDYLNLRIDSLYNTSYLEPENANHISEKPSKPNLNYDKNPSR